MPLIQTGSSPPGEFFSPGYDCSSILDKDPKAKDGFYWITIGGKIPRKVCVCYNTNPIYK